MIRPLRFLHLTTFYPPFHFGGDAVYVRRLAHALADAGHDVDVVHSVDAFRLLHRDPPQVGADPHRGVRVWALEHRLGALPPLLAQQTGRPLLDRRRLREILRASTYDVVHYHNISLLGPAVLALPAAATTVKLYTSHDHWLVCPMHVLWKYGSRPCERPRCLTCVLRGRRPPQVWRYTSLLARSGRHVDRFLAPSRFTARLHADRGFPFPFDCLPYFQDRVDDEWRAPAPRPHERPYFLFVGRLETVKGVAQLVDAWREVERHDLLIAGSGSLAERLRSRAAGNPRVRFLGQVGERELGPLYRHAVACIVPSLTFETFGMVVIEAHARKTPVIARNLGALPELVAEGGGLLFHSTRELLAAIGRLAESPALRDDLGERGYRAFLRLWSREAHMDGYFDVLRQCARGRGGSVPREKS